MYWATTALVNAITGYLLCDSYVCLPFERQAELVLEQMKLRLEAAGSSLSQVLECNVYCTPQPAHFATFNYIYARYFQSDALARIFLHVPSFTGPFNIEIDGGGGALICHAR